MFQADAKLATQLLTPTYSYILNSEDLYDLDLPLSSNQAHGGTLTAWKSNLDPFVTVLTTESSRILPILLELPGFQPTIHINIYLPTSGREKEFIDALANLQNTVDELSEKYPTALVYIRGDANACSSSSLTSTREGCLSSLSVDLMLEAEKIRKINFV